MQQVLFCLQKKKYTMKYLLLASLLITCSMVKAQDTAFAKQWQLIDSLIIKKSSKICPGKNTGNIFCCKAAAQRCSVA